MEGLTALVCPLTDRNLRGLQRKVTLAYFDGPEAARDHININHQTGPNELT